MTNVSREQTAECCIPNLATGSTVWGNRNRPRPEQGWLAEAI